MDILESILQELVEIKLILSEHIDSSKNKTTSEKVYFLTPDEACYFLDISRQTLYSWTSQKKIPYYKDGHKILFKNTELIDFLKSRKKAKAPRKQLTREEMLQKAVHLHNEGKSYAEISQALFDNRNNKGTVYRWIKDNRKLFER